LFNVLCTGNPNYIGIPYSLSKIFKNIDFVHKSNGFDLTNFEEFKILINNYNVFINHSAFNYTIQKDLLQLCVDQWQKNKKRGHIINIGSVLEYEFAKKYKIDTIEYYESKTDLRNLGLELCTENIKITHFVIGAIQNPGSFHPDKLNCKEIAKVIKIILKYEFNVPIIGIEKLNDTWSKNSRYIKGYPLENKTDYYVKTS